MNCWLHKRVGLSEVNAENINWGHVLDSEGTPELNILANLRANPESITVHIWGIVIPCPAKAGVVARRNILPADVEPIHCLQGRVLCIVGLVGEANQEQGKRTGTWNRKPSYGLTSWRWLMAENKNRGKGTSSCFNAWLMLIWQEQYHSLSKDKDFNRSRWRVDRV